MAAGSVAEVAEDRILSRQGEREVLVAAVEAQTETRTKMELAVLSEQEVLEVVRLTTTLVDEVLDQAVRENFCCVTGQPNLKI